MNSTAIIKITAEVFENILTPDNPLFKERGTTVFEIETDPIKTFNTRDYHMVKSIKTMLEETNNDKNHFKYVTHEVLYGSPHKLDSNRFNELLNQR